MLSVKSEGDFNKYIILSIKISNKAIIIYKEIKNDLYFEDKII